MQQDECLCNRGCMSRKFIRMRGLRLWSTIQQNWRVRSAPILETSTPITAGEYTDLMSRALRGATEVSRVDRSGVLQEQIYLDYSQERLASYGLQPSNLKGILNARNITLPGGALEAGSKNILIDPSGEFTNTAKDIGNVIVGTSGSARRYTCGTWWIFAADIRARRVI